MPWIVLVSCFEFAASRLALDVIPSGLTGKVDKAESVINMGAETHCKN